MVLLLVVFLVVRLLVELIKSGGGSSVALSATTLISEITTSGTDFSLVNGTAGQVKIITMVVDGGDATLHTSNFIMVVVQFVFNDVGDSVILVYHNTIGWKAIINNGTTIS